MTCIENFQNNRRKQNKRVFPGHFVDVLAITQTHFKAAFLSINQTFKRKLLKDLAYTRLKKWKKLNFRLCEKRDE